MVLRKEIVEWMRAAFVRMPLAKESGADLDSLLVAPLKLPSPPSSIALEHRVEFLDQSYEGKHVVYVVDAGSYQLKGPKAVQRLEEMKLAVLESLTKLSSNSYFNLVYVGICEMPMLWGKRFFGRMMKINGMRPNGSPVLGRRQLCSRRAEINFTPKNFSMLKSYPV